MELSWLEDFLALALERNFSRAAERRNVTQPAFSRRIQALENWMGAALFSRSPHQVSLTAAGEQFRSAAESITRDLRKARQDVQEAAGRAKASLTMASTHALSFTFAPQLLRSNAQLNELGTINLISDSMEACEHLMIHGDVTFLLCHLTEQAATRLNARQFKVKIIGQDILVPLSAADQGAPKWQLQADGPRIPYFAYDSASGMGRILADEWQRRAISLNTQVILTSRLASVLHSMVRRGEGVAWLPQSLAQDDMDSGALLDAGFGQYSVPVKIGLFRPITRLSPAAESFWAALDEVNF